VNRRQQRKQREAKGGIADCKVGIANCGGSGRGSKAIEQKGTKEAKEGHCKLRIAKWELQNESGGGG
jgi:hypothetical protein